jgi:hypothetical protein
MKQNSPVLIVENCTSGLKPVNESIDKKQYILSGTFTEFDVKNRNERIYTADRFLPHLNELLKKKEETGVIYGEFDHPDVFDTSLARVSHTVESMSFDQQNNRIVGEIRLLNTHWGKEAKALVDDNCPIFVSSRAAGITEANGTVSLKKLFTYDAVADPGFSSAKMEMKAINESLGFNENSNFRIYDISDESKFNELIMDNKNNDFVTKNQMVEYSNYLTEQIESVSKTLTNGIDGKDKEEILKLSELLENLQTQQDKVTNYLDYLAEQVQFVFNENTQLKENASKLEKTNENLVKYSNYLAEKVDKNINYSQYIAESLDKSIEFSEYIAEHVDKNIEFSDYLAENIEKSIDYSEYIAENLDSNISKYEKISENLEAAISYSQYLAENLDSNIDKTNSVNEKVDNSIKYAEYIAEHLDNNIAYAEYIAENVSDTQAYGNYIAESLDKTIDVIKGNKIFENVDEDTLKFNTPDNVESYYQDNQGQQAQVIEPANNVETEITETPEGQGEEFVEEQPDVEVQTEITETPEDGIETEITETPEGGEEVETTIEEPGVEGTEIPEEIAVGMNIAIGSETGQVVAVGETDGKKVVTSIMDGTGEELTVESNKVKVITGSFVENETKLSESIKNLILEAKKRKAAEEEKPHFFEFLTEKNKQYFNQLSAEDKEKVTFALNESKYYSESDVIKIMTEALTVKKSFEDVMIENMPNELLPVYESLEDKYKQSMISQARLYPNLDTPSRIEAFWKSREMDKYTKVKENKKVLNESKVIDNTKLSDEEVEAFIRRIKNS